MRTEVGLVLKHVNCGEEKENTMIYLIKPPPPTDDYYYEEDTYAVNNKMGGFRPKTLGSNQENWRQAKVNQGR